MATTFSNKTHILGQLWSNYQGSDNFVDFIEYNDLGLPLAYMIDIDICEANERGEEFINETWDSFLTELGLADAGFEHIDDVLAAGEITVAE